MEIDNKSEIDNENYNKTLYKVSSIRKIYDEKTDGTQLVAILKKFKEYDKPLLESDDTKTPTDKFSKWFYIVCWIICWVLAIIGCIVCGVYWETDNIRLLCEWEISCFILLLIDWIVIFSYWIAKKYLK